MPVTVAPESLCQPRACFINAFQLGRHVPQGLKPVFSQALNGTAKSRALPKTDL